MTVAVVLVAAGAGERLGAGVPKALVNLAGRSLLDWSVAAFRDHPGVDEAVVVAPAAACASLAEQLAAAGFVTAVVPGGTTRPESVQRGLAALNDRVDHVLVHDAARPLVPAGVISAVLAALRSGADAVIPVLPVTDTVKRVDGDGIVTATVERSALRRVQTPQGFAVPVLREAYRELTVDGAIGPTDDAGVVEARGGTVVTVPGDEESFKITTPDDLLLAELLVAAR
jgi:2-C-methyl-D-erythritol 4-phosphate cytidylyltransferase